MAAEGRRFDFARFHQFAPCIPFSLTPGVKSNIRGQHKGADDLCKIVAVGALPTVSTNFPIVQW
jgi:hypothetical protein